MDISGSHRIAAPREDVWAALNDPAALQACIPGCGRLEPTGDGAFEGTVATKVGPIRTEIAGDAAISDAAAPERFRISAKGADPVAGGGEGEGEVTLSEDGDGTLVSYSGTIEAHGKIAQLGNRLLTGVFRRQVEQFLENLAERLGAGVATEPLADRAERPDAVTDAPPLVHEELADAPAAVLDAPPLASGANALPPESNAIAPTATPVVPEPAALAAADATSDPGGASVTTRIMLVAAVVAVIGAIVYYMLWQAPA